MKLGKVRLFHKVVIGDEKDPYILRWVLFGHPALPGVMVHKIIRSDHERSLHDHPWSFISLVLKTGYWEEHEGTGDRTKIKIFNKRWSLLYRPAEWRHRVIIPCEPAWTLVFMSPRKRWWGFWVEKASVYGPVFEWCHWKKYDENLGICSTTNLATKYGED